MMLGPDPQVQVLNRIRAEYLEMPGLTLKSEQLQRLCGIDRVVCEAVLEDLVRTGFLAIRPDGSYGRIRDTEPSRSRPANAGLAPNSHATASRLGRRAS